MAIKFRAVDRLFNEKINVPTYKHRFSASYSFDIARYAFTNSP